MLLSEKRGEVIEKENIGEIIFKDVENYSLYAMAKFIQRLREKLEEYDYPSNLFIPATSGSG